MAGVRLWPASSMATERRLLQCASGVRGMCYVRNDPAWEDLVGVGPTGAMLSGLDGHVGARWVTLRESPVGELRAALRTILDETAEGASHD